MPDRFPEDERMARLSARPAPTLSEEGKDNPAAYWSAPADALGREGMLTVWDNEGHYVGCIGTEKWAEQVALSEEGGERPLTLEQVFEAGWSFPNLHDEYKRTFAALQAAHEERKLDREEFKLACEQIDKLTTKLAWAERQFDELLKDYEKRGEEIRRKDEALRWIADYGHEADGYELPPKNARKIARAALATTQDTEAQEGRPYCAYCAGPCKGFHGDV